ncbi:MAG: heavy metal translocating P-type ATPase [Planctomycetota bacterium]|nr:heavy metal translocating P-type ATPase [Planctomycetota bacterium]
MLKAPERVQRETRLTRACSHCGLPASAMPSDETAFCCNGCMGAYALIHDLGLESYYDLKSAVSSTNMESVREQTTRSHVLEDLEAAGVPVRTMADGSCAVRLAVDGMHCAACTWLIERVQPTIPGLISAQVRMSDQTVELVYDPTQTQPIDVSRKLAKLGYSLAPWAVDSEDDQGFQQQQREHWSGIALAGFFAANAMWIGIALYAGEATGMTAGHETFLRWVGTLLAVLAVALPGRMFFYTAWQAIQTRTPHIDIPIALSLLIGTLGSLVGVVRGVGHIYFDSLASLILLLRIGRFIQFRVQYRTSLSLSRLLRWNTVTATRIESDGTRKTIPTNRLVPGQRLEVGPGETIPADGIVVAGRSKIDTSLINGESHPIAVRAGEAVEAGTTNISSSIELEITAAGENSRVGRLMELVRSASAQRTPATLSADKLSKWFVLAVLLLAVGTWFAWANLANATVATQHTMALLTIACPCALALAAPLVITVALGRAARRQIWIRDGNCLERLATPGILWLDKTGTLTTGRMRVLAWHGRSDPLQYAAALERTIRHPIADAISAFAAERGIETSLADVEQLEHSPGRGAKGMVNGYIVAIGTEAWLHEQGTEVSSSWLKLQANAFQHGRSVVWLSIAGELCGMFETGDPLRTDAIITLRAISERGWRLGLLSGDRQEVVDGLAFLLEESGVPVERALGQQSPEDKLEVIREAKGDRAHPVAMVGDGVNDAAALAMSDVGIAIRGGSGQSLVAAPIFLANDRLSSVLELLDASTSVKRGIRRCFAASLIYNTVTITLAMFGWIHPLIAAVLMPISGLTVLTMAMTTNAFPRETLK